MSGKRHRTEDQIDEGYQDIIKPFSEDDIVQKDAITNDMMQLGFDTFEEK